MKTAKLILVIFFIFSGLTIKAQVAINKDGSTADPSALLDIKATDGGLLVPRMSATEMNNITSPATGLLLFNTSANSFYLFNGNSWVSLTTDDGDWVVSGNNMYCGITGNVGIGTTSPTAKLEVAGQIKITGGSPGSNKVLTSDGNGLATWETLPQDSDNQNLSLSGDSLNIDNGQGVDLSSFKDNTDDQTLSVSGHALSIESGNTVTIPNDADNLGNHTATENITLNSHYLSGDGDNEGIWINSTGNVGIGTMSPTAKLEVAGQIKITGGSPGSNKVLTSDGNGLATWETLPQDSDNQNLSLSGDSLNIDNGQGVDLSSFKDNTDDQTLSVSGHALSIESGNTVTIPNDADNLGNHTATENITLNSHYLSGDGDNEGIWINSTGNVGIGTNNPQSALEVTGHLKMVDGSQSNGKILVSDTNGIASWSDPASISDGDWTVNGNDMYSAVSGNVGIGINAPQARLHISDNGTTSPSLFDIQADDNNPYALRILNNSYSTNWDNAFRMFQLNDGSFIFENMAFDLLTLKNQYVGIGTTNPSSSLHISGSDNPKVKVQDTDGWISGDNYGTYTIWDQNNEIFTIVPNAHNWPPGSNGGLKIFAGKGGNEASVDFGNFRAIGSVDNTDLIITTRGIDGYSFVERLRVKGGTDESNMVIKHCNLGIGGESTEAKLHIMENEASTTPALLDVEADNSDPWAFRVLNITYSTNWANAYRAYQDNDGTYVIENMGQQTLSLKNGKLGVGTTDPKSALQVVGLPEYSDNAAAISAGLIVGAFYRTGDVVKVVH